MTGFRQILHRQVWQRLPRQMRRTALFATTCALAPRPGKFQTGREPQIYVAGTFGAPTGLGASARNCFRALSDSNLRPVPVDLTSALLQRSELAVPPAERPEAGPAAVIMHVNAPLVPLAAMTLGRGFLQGKKVIGYWHWELERLPSDWLFGLSFVHEIWVPSVFVKRAVEQATSKPVHVVPHPVYCDHSGRIGAASNRLTVLTVFDLASSFERKNPLAAIHAFKSAFGHRVDVRMIVKVTNPDCFEEGMNRLRAAIGQTKNIELVTEVLSEEALGSLIAGCDILLSLHRAEGFGLSLAQAMALGRVVVATAWSSTTEFMTNETARLVPCSLIPANDPQCTYQMPGSRWADPDIEAAAAILRVLAANPALRQEIGRRARLAMSEHFSPETYALKARALLDWPADTFAGDHRKLLSAQ